MWITEILAYQILMAELRPMGTEQWPYRLNIEALVSCLPEMESNVSEVEEKDFAFMVRKVQGWTG